MKLAFITDLHELSGSLVKAVKMAEKQGCDELVCLGDILGYDAVYNPNNQERSARKCLRLIKDQMKYVVTGNHDTIKEAQGTDLSSDDLEYMESLPQSIIFENNGSRILFSHYLFPDLTGSTMVFIKWQNQLNPVYDFFKHENILLSFCGHDHPSGVGFGFPAKPKWNSNLKNAVHYMPFNTYHIDHQMTCLVLPPLATANAFPGLTIWDTSTSELKVIQLNPYSSSL